MQHQRFLSSDTSCRIRLEFKSQTSRRVELESDIPMSQTRTTVEELNLCQRLENKIIKLENQINLEN